MVSFQFLDETSPLFAVAPKDILFVLRAIQQCTIVQGSRMVLLSIIL